VSLLAYALRRLAWSVPLLLLVMLATYALMRGMGGDPFVLPEGFAGLPLPLERDLREYYRIDEPWFVEFAHYVGNVAQFEFGPSLNRRGVTVDSVIEQSLPVTGLLVFLGAAVALPVGFALGLLGAVRRGAGADTTATALATVLLVVPVFFVAWVLSRYPALEWHWVPLGWDSWEARRSATSRGSSARRSSSSSARTTCARRAPRGCAATASCSCTCSATRSCRCCPRWCRCSPC
jgi:oligopeptide transport system permease protein